jgi:hypothetical protein
MGKKFFSFPDHPDAPSLYTNRYWVKAAKAVNLTIHHHSVLRLRVRGDLPTLLHTCSCHVNREQLYLLPLKQVTCIVTDVFQTIRGRDHCDQKVFGKSVFIMLKLLLICCTPLHMHAVMCAHIADGAASFADGLSHCPGMFK